MVYESNESQIPCTGIMSVEQQTWTSPLQMLEKGIYKVLFANRRQEIDSFPAKEIQ